MLDTAATFLANAQAGSQAHTPFTYAHYSRHSLAQYNRHSLANAQADSQAHTSFAYA